MDCAACQGAGVQGDEASLPGRVGGVPQFPHPIPQEWGTKGG